MTLATFGKNLKPGLVVGFGQCWKTLRVSLGVSLRPDLVKS